MTLSSLGPWPPAPSALASRPFSPGRAVRRRPTPAACRSWPAPCPNRVRHRRSCAFPGESVPLDLLVEIRPRHVERPCGLAHIPIVFAQLGEQERALGRLLELLERLALEQRTHPRLIRVAAADETIHVVRSDPRPGRQDEEALHRIAQLAHVAGPIELLESGHGFRREHAWRHPFPSG